MGLIDKFFNGHKLSWWETIGGYTKKCTICKYSSYIMDDNLIIQSKNILIKIPVIAIDGTYYEEKYGLIIGKIPVGSEYNMITFCLELK